MFVLHGNVLPGHVPLEAIVHAKFQKIVPCVPFSLIKSQAHVTLVLPASSSIRISSAPRSSRRTSKLVTKCKPSRIVCLLGDKDRRMDETKESPWTSVVKVFGNLGGRSVEDVLREQIQKQEYYGGANGGGRKPPQGGNGKGGTGSTDSNNGSNAEFLNEAVQVMLATFGFLVMYIYIICGPELTRLVRDYVKFMNGGGQSVRLKKAMRWWRALHNLFSRGRKLEDMWMENQIMNTTTWFGNSEKLQTS